MTNLRSNIQLATFAAGFPSVASDPPLLPAWTSGDYAVIEAALRARMVDYFLPYWQQLAQTYAGALAGPHADDRGRLEVAIEDWPETLEAQQRSLYQLLEESKLRLPWHSEMRWQLDQRTLFTEGQRRVAAELAREVMEGSRPLAEIPLYHGFIRASCQQLICMPLAQWEAMYSDSTCFEPGMVDEAVVSCLAHRIAKVFNAPPQSPEQRAQVPSADQSIVWDVRLHTLTNPDSSHGMRDRLFDEYGRPFERASEQTPTWRFDGFCGQLRVTLEDGSPWHVTVLAPAHFVGNLMAMVRGQENAEG